MNPGAHHSSDNMDPSPLDWARQKGVGDEVMRRTHIRVLRRRRRTLGVTAVVAALGVVGILLRPKPASVAIAVPPSAHITVPDRQTLPDGSIVELREGAQIASDFSGPSRRVTLSQGEAHFRVAHDPQRPFVVLAHGVEIRDIGTAFSVDVRQTAVEVLVSEGRVSLARTVGLPAAESDVFSRPDSATAATIVDAGNRAVISVPATGAAVPTDLPAPQVSPISDHQMSESDSWRIPHLEFAGTPLSEAVAMFNRYASLRHGTRVVLADVSLGKLQLSGILRADNTETLLQVLDANFAIKADPEVDHEIRLHLAP